MSKVIMTCGKICSGKSTYAKQISSKNKAVLLSVDEITLALFGQNCGDKHDEYVAKTEKYLFDKSLEILQIGVNVVLDWGFWTKAERQYAKEFYKSKNIQCEFHFIDVGNEIWHQRLNKRNNAVLEGKTNAYYVDENLARKFDHIFEIPSKDEIDVWIES
ncbi:MAG: ATP-binding protein [Ruminococcus sp.]|nr:ATP-binding protein [Ruminococcus sp.]